MATVRQIVSDIRSDNRMVNSENLITNRNIVSELRGASLLLIRQQTDKRRLFNSPNIFTNLSCIEMEEASLGECCEYSSPYLVSKSVKKLPKIAEGNYGLLIQKCGSIDTLYSFKESTARRFANTLQLGLKKGMQYFWLFNEHIYVSNSDIKAISLSAYFEEDVPNDLLCPQGCDCNYNECDPCTNPLDLQFKCPGYLEHTVKDMVISRLLKTYFNVPQSNDSKDIDTQAKNNVNK